jgi:ATP-dependent helicase/nuclease subunit A
VEFDGPTYEKVVLQRRKKYQETMETPLFVNPTLLKRREEERLGQVPRGQNGSGINQEALFIGELAHRFLQRWDFSRDPQSYREQLLPFLDLSLDAHADHDRMAVQRELEEIFNVFFNSSAYEELKGSHILGREIPLLIPWGEQIMEGVMDVLYEKDGELYVADYKTDRVQGRDLSELVQGYTHQAEIYSEAVRRCVQREVTGFKIFLLRSGEAIPIGVETSSSFEATQKGKERL